MEEHTRHGIQPGRRADAHAASEPTRELQRVGRLLILAAIVAAGAYAYFLLAPQYRGAPWVWGLALVGEGLTIAQAIGVWWTILAHDRHREPAGVFAWRRRLLQGRDVPTIDVFVTVAGEPLELVRRTVAAARDMLVPHATWVLDDGASDEVRTLCAELGVGYLRREGNAGAKAGNVNAALQRTHGEFVVLFDADHVPTREFLVEALPYMADPRVALVQTPQWYANRDRLVPLGASEAQRIFYELVCPGKDHVNAAFCVGTNAIFRRAALAEVGGLYAESLSEDIWTTLLLHRRGWRTAYVPKVLAHGLAPDTLAAYFKQQFRWARGGFELLLTGRLLRGPGLTLDQRLQYLFTGTNYLLGFATVAFQLIPAAFLLAGEPPVRADLATWVAFYVPFVACQLLITWIQAGGFRVAAVVTSIGVAPVYVRAFFSVLFRRGSTWSVTNTQGAIRSVELVLPQIALLSLNALAIVVGISVLDDENRVGVLLAVGWAALHAAILGRIVLEAFLDASRERRRIRAEWRARRADRPSSVPAGARVTP